MTKKSDYKEIRNTYYLRQIEPVVKELSDKHGVPKEEVESMIIHFFETFKDILQHPTMPKVQITNLGTFKPSYSSITNFIRKSFKKVKEGNMEEEKLREIITSLWPVKNRLSEEKHGVNTWKKYKKERWKSKQ